MTVHKTDENVKTTPINDRRKKIIKKHTLIEILALFEGGDKFQVLNDVQLINKATEKLPDITRGTFQLHLKYKTTGPYFGLGST